MSTLTAPVPWFGAKRDLAPQIVPHFGRHDIYYDLFAGSLSCLLAKQPARQEVASDRHPDLLNLLRCLADEERARDLFDFSRRFPLSETLFLEAAERLTEPFDAPTDDDSTCSARARDYLLVSWQGPSGLAGTEARPRFAKRNTASGGSTAARWRGVADSIPTWHERLRNVEFRAADAFELIGAIPDRPGVAIYADPPYHPDSRSVGRYAFELAREQHAELAARLEAFQAATVVVSYRRCPAIDALYGSFERIALAAPKRLKNQTGGEQPVETADEVLYVRRGRGA